jgi:hypothetical protein
MQNIEARTDFSRGYNRGNYGNAYESQDWETWYADNSGQHSDAYREGMILGFFGSYELHEIATAELAEQVATLRAKHGIGDVSAAL